MDYLEIASLTLIVCGALVLIVVLTPIMILFYDSQKRKHVQEPINWKKNDEKYE